MSESKEWAVELEGDIVDELLSALEARSEESDHIEFLVGFNKGLKIEIFSDEHPPPHFRVLYQGESNNFRISDCSAMNGDGLLQYFRDIRKWHKNNKHVLIDTWNRTRPSDCPVGMYKE
jgi:type I restriction enzyme, R subunit